MNHKLITARRIVSTFTLMAAFVVMQFSSVQFAHAATTDTWTGTAGDKKFSTAANWSTGIIPVTGDTINFVPSSTGVDYQSIDLTNDLGSVTLAGITETNGSTGYTTQYYIDTINLSAGNGITTVGTGTKSVGVYSGTSTTQGGTVNVSGDLTITNGWSATFHISGNLIANSYVGLLPGSTVTGNATFYTSGYADHATIGGTITLPNNNQGLYIKGASQVMANNITIGTYNSTVVLNQLGFGNCATENLGGMGGGGASYVAVQCATYGSATYTLSGTLTLNADLVIDVAQQSDVKITGNVIYNGHTIKLSQESQGTLEVGSTSATTSTIVTNLADSQPTADYTVQNKETTTLDGVRQNVSVNSGGLLMGTGSAAIIQVLNGGIIAPGHSPGKLTAVNYLSIAGTYQAQIKDATDGGYDQIIVGASTDTTGHDVQIQSTAILDTSLYTGYSINKGDQFMIIKNLQPASQKVSGTFSGLAEGAQFTVSGITFSISYIGGDGNDVVLTALTTGKAPSAPNTGLASLKLANPIVLAGLGVAAAGILFTLARRRLNK